MWQVRDVKRGKKKYLCKFTLQGQIKRPHSKCSIKTSAMNKQQRVVVRGGNSFLKGTEAYICRPDPRHREVCCLPGAQIRKLLSIIQPSEYNPLLFQMSANDIATVSLTPMKRNFGALGRQLKDSGAQIVFSSIPPVMARDQERNR